MINPEREKYLGLYGSGSAPRYGHSNHGGGSLRLLAKWQPASVLDIGCGYNEFARQVRAQHPEARVMGIDFACPGADLQADLATGLPWADGEWDLATAFDVLEHLRPEQVDAALAEMARVSRRFCVSIAYQDSVIRWKGQTLHPTVRPESWWVTRLMRAGAIGIGSQGRYLYGTWQPRLPMGPQTDVVLVGNGPGLLRAPLGPAIDRFSEVVRFNDWVTAGFERHTGERVTWWSAFFKGHEKPLRHSRVLALHERDQMPAGIYECHRVPGRFFQRMWDRVRERAQWRAGLSEAPPERLLASSGLTVAVYLLEVGGVEVVHLAGFDHFRKDHSGQHHYWLPRTFGRPKEHDGDLEAALIGELEAAGRIVRLG